MPILCTVRGGPFVIKPTLNASIFPTNVTSYNDAFLLGREMWHQMWDLLRHRWIQRMRNRLRKRIDSISIVYKDMVYKACSASGEPLLTMHPAGRNLPRVVELSSRVDCVHSVHVPCVHKAFCQAHQLTQQLASGSCDSVLLKWLVKDKDQKDNPKRNNCANVLVVIDTC